MRDALRSALRTTPMQRRDRHGGFTLIEMVVVVGIILIIMGLTLPSLQSLWDERKVAEAHNMIQGLLMTSRARALQAGGIETGLFFHIDAAGSQRIISIRKAAPELPSDAVVWQNVFEIASDGDRTPPIPNRYLTLAAPIRAVPRYAVDVENNDRTNAPYTFSAAELANNNFSAPVQESNIAQRHRNYFTMIYAGNGQLTIRRDVLIIDADNDNDGFGDVMGMRVGIDAATPKVETYWPQAGATAQPLDPLPLNRGVEDLITDETGNAINFPSVDGLLLYDDAALNEQGGDAGAARRKREFLLRTAQPFYVNRWTGRVILGPVAEVEATTP